MSSDESWSRRRAVEVHDETAQAFVAEYGSGDIFDSPFRYGRHLIDRAWADCVSELPRGATCLDVGCGVGAYMTRLLDRGFRSNRHRAKCRDAEACSNERPSRSRLRRFGVAIASLQLDGRFRIRHRGFQISRGRGQCARSQRDRSSLKPGGLYFGTYVNKWALDGFRQLSQLRRLSARMKGRSRRYHVEFETPFSLQQKLRAAGFSTVAVHGAMFAPLRVLHKLSRRLAAAISKRTMPYESGLSRSGPFRSMAGHLIVVARR